MRPKGEGIPSVRSAPPVFETVRDDVENLLGVLDEEQWETVHSAFTEIRGEIDQMHWFASGPNSVGAEKDGTRWNELVFAPRDSEHEEMLMGMLARLKIFPWQETQQNVRVLVIENRRDVSLLRAGLIFDYLYGRVDLAERAQQLDVLREQRAKEDNERLRAYREREQERERLNKIDLDRDEFRSKSKEEKDRVVAEFFAALPEPGEDTGFERPIRLPQDAHYRFGYPPATYKGFIPSRIPKELERTDALSEETPDMDVELKDIEERFISGALNEETLEQEIVRSVGKQKRTPALTLFPRKYQWVKEPRQPGYLLDRASGLKLHEADVESLARTVQGGSPESRLVAMREIILAYRALMLYLIREIQKRHVADPDELLQAGLIGLITATDRAELHEEKTNFRAYAMIYMEGFMREQVVRSRSGPLQEPMGVSEERKKIIQAERALRSKDPGTAVTPEDMARVLYAQKITRGDDMATFDRYLRKVLYTYEESQLDVLDTMDPTVVDARGASPFVDVLQSGEVELQDLERVMRQLLRSLPPREERILRLRFGITPEHPETFAHRVYSFLGNEFALTKEEVVMRLHALTEQGNLSSPQVQERLPLEDKIFLLRYRELLATSDTTEHTLEQIGEQFGVNRERIRQIEARALRTLKHPSRSRKLEPYREPWRRPPKSLWE